MIQWLLFNRINGNGTWVPICHSVQLRLVNLPVIAFAYFTLLQNTFIWTYPAHYAPCRFVLEHCDLPVNALIPLLYHGMKASPEGKHTTPAEKAAHLFKKSRLLIFFILFPVFTIPLALVTKTTICKLLFQKEIPQKSFRTILKVSS